jgi:hypothetical protein
MRLIWILTIAGPAFAIAGLFLANWLKRSDLRAAGVTAGSPEVRETGGGLLFDTCRSPYDSR